MLPILLSLLKNTAARRSVPPLLLLLTLLAAPGHAQETGPPDKPILRIETGMHTASIWRISVDAAGRYLVTASQDKTVRVWDAHTGALLNILRPPIGDGDEGKLYAVSMSPDGRTVACGGETGYAWDQSDCLYLFDRATGALRARVTGLPNVINQLVYSPDGRFLAATLGDGGVRLYRTADDTLAAKDADYGGESYGAAFTSVGGALRLVTSCYDGFLRLYDVGGTGGPLHRRARGRAPGGRRPYGVAFSPGGGKIAVGFRDTPKVSVLSGSDLSSLYAPNTAGVHDRDLSSVCWSADGRTLYAGGTYMSAGKCRIRDWVGGGRGGYTDVAAADNAIFDMQPRAGGGVFFGSAVPTWGTVGTQDNVATLGSAVVADFRYSGGSLPTFSVSPDARAVQFEYEDFGKSLAVFSLADRKLTSGGDSAGLNPPTAAADGLDVQGWEGTTAPTLNGKALTLETYESARCLAISPDRSGFLLGSDWHLRLFSKDGTQKWQVPAPDVAWAVNVSADGKTAVAAFADGTIRWFRMTDGQELLALFPHADRKRWVLWTPSGYYDCSPGAEDLIGWHVNHGTDQAADFFPVSRFRDTYYRPDVVSKILQTQDEATALSQADAEGGRRTQAVDIGKTLPPVVAIASPDDNAGASGDTLTVQYTLRTPSGEPVTEVRALVDGRPAQTEGGLSVVSLAGETRTLRVPLPPRDCLVSVLAFNKYGAGEPASVHVRWVGTAKAVEAVATRSDAGPEFTIQPTLYVLAVGIGKYDDPALRLTYPAKDAGDFLRSMRSQKGRLYKDVVVYPAPAGADGAGGALTDGAATKEAIEDGLDWLQKQTTSNDVAMIFLSGHGSNDSDGKYFFLPVGFSRAHVKSTGLPWTELVATVQAIAGKVILFNDSCHSGNVLGSGLKGLPDDTGAINELISAENGAVVFAASTGSEYAREDPAWGNGAFTKALVEGVGGQADYGHTGRITVNMLSLYVGERVKALTGGSQHPTANKPATVRDFPLALDGQK